MAPPVKRVQTSDEDLNRVQDSILPTVNALRACPILDGRLVETETDSNGHEIEIVLTTTPKNVAHKLGRAYRGWWVTDRNADARVWVDPPTGTPSVDPNPDHAKFVRLDASATVTVRLWVF